MAAKKEEKGPSMIETFQEFKETKNIDRTTLVSVLEESFRNVIAKLFGSDENFDVIVNPDKGDFEIHRNRVVVADGEVQDENKQISLSDAQKIEPDYEVGEEVSEEVNFSKFGRRAILNLRQTLASKILELEHDSLYNKYKDKVGTIVSGEVYQMWRREVLLIDDEGNELHLPKGEQIPADSYHKGETVRAVVLRVDNENNNPRIILSRTSPTLPRKAARGRGARDSRRPHHHTARGAYARREGQGGRRELRRAHRPRGGLRRREGQPRARHSARAVQREHRRHQLLQQHAALHTARPQPRQGVEHHARRGRTTRPRCTCSPRRCRWPSAAAE